jgi:ubiquinol-cytochrome c reductase iron-sulfur subunit
VFQDVPAPINLLVPPHHYTDDNTIVIGVDPQGAA